MRGYLAFIGVGIITSIAYRSAYWFGLFGLLLRVSLLYFFWSAAFSSHSTIATLNFEQMAGYIVLSSLIVEFNAFGAGRLLSLMVARGEIAVELTRPYSIVGRLLAFNAGQKIVELTKSGLVLVIVGIILTPSTFLVDPIYWLALAIAIFLGSITIQLFDIVIACLAFWTTNTWGLWLVRNSILTLFSGALVPLSLFPDWFQTIASMLPYGPSLYTPALNFLTAADTSAWLKLYWSQIVWIASSALCAVFTIRLAIRRVEIFGG